MSLIAKEKQTSFHNWYRSKKKSIFICKTTHPNYLWKCKNISHWKIRNMCASLNCLRTCNSTHTRTGLWTLYTMFCTIANCVIFVKCWSCLMCTWVLFCYGGPGRLKSHLKYRNLIIESSEFHQKSHPVCELNMKNLLHIADSLGAFSN